MKKFYLLLTLIVVTIIQVANAQAPQGIPYQAVARDNAGNLIKNQSISLRFSIHDGSANGAVVYSETHAVTTDALGLFSVNIGEGSSNSNYTLASVNWGSGAKYTQVELDVAGGSNFVDMGTTKMMSVPYALYAGSSAAAPSVFQTTTDNPNAIHNTNSGNVGIGTDLPAEKLDVAGNLRVRQNAIVQGNNLVQGVSTANSFVKEGGISSQYLMADGTTSTGPDLTGYATTASVTDLANNVAMNYATNSTVTDLANNVAMNYATNATVNDLANNVAMNYATNATVNDLANNVAMNYATNDALANTNTQVQTNTTDIANLQTQIGNVQSNFVTTADNPNAIHNTNSGNVGIGTDLPAQKLDVAGNVRVRQNQFVDGFSMVQGDAMVQGNSMIGQNLEVSGLAYISSLTIPSGNPAQGKVLTSDADGHATWQMPASPDLTGYATTAALDASNTQLTSQINDLSTVVSNTSTQVQSNTTAIASLQNQNDVQSSQISTLNDGLSATNTQVQTNTSNISNVQAQTTMLQNGVDILQGQVQTNTTDIANLQTQIGNVQSNFVRTTGNPNHISNVNAGNVGIGTDLPSEKLDVNGNLKVNGNFTSGLNTTASGANSAAMGKATQAQGENSTARGWNTTASNYQSTASGYGTTASGINSTASGYQTTASGNNSTASGYQTTASNYQSTASGLYTTASGWISTASGYGTTASGDISTTMGDHTTSKSFAETAIGMNNTDYTPNSIDGFNATDRLFVIGNGTDQGNKSDAMVVLKNGNTTINGTTTANSFVKAGGQANEYLMADGSVSTGGTGGAGLFVTTTANAYNISNVNAGNVGIGTDAPTEKLDVNGNLKVNGKLVINANSADQALDLSTSDGYANVRVLQNSNSSIDHDIYLGFESGANSNLHLFSNNQETMVITNGEVHANGNTTINGTTTANSFVKAGGQANEYLMADGSTSTGGSSTLMGSIGVSSTANGATITSGVLSLTPADGTNGGIVTSSAQTFGGKKTFADSAVAKGFRATDSVTTKGFRATGTATANSFVKTGGTSSQYLMADGSTSAGTVATTMGTIGASSTANGGTISSGVLSLAPANGTNGGIVTSSAQTFGGKKTFADSAVAKGFRATDSITTKGFRATGTAIADSVGIGTNAPTEKLEVAGNIKGSGKITSNAPQYGITHKYGNVEIATYIQDDFAGWFGTKSNHPLWFYTNNGSSMMALTTTGKVGIGINDPSEKLDVNGNLKVRGTATADSVSTRAFKATGTAGADSISTRAFKATGTVVAKKLVVNVTTTGDQGLDLSTSNGYANVRVLQNTNASIDKDIYLGFESGATSSLHLYSNNTEAMSVTGGKVYVTNNVIAGGSLISLNPTNAAINATATATVDNIISGYITSTSAAATTITLPTATAIATALGTVSRGTQLEFTVDNVSGAQTVTIALGTGITAITPVITGTNTLTVSVANGIGRFRLVFTSATAAKIIRVF